MARLIFAGFLIFFGAGELLACGPFAIEASYFFVPESPDSEACGGGSWNSDYNYGSITASRLSPQSCLDSEEPNLEAWAKLAGPGVTAADVRKVLIDKSHKPGDARNSFSRFLSKPAPLSKEAFAYVNLSFKIEQYAALIRDDVSSWREGPDKKATKPAAQALLDAALKARTGASNAEIKHRYSLQILRLKFYSGDFQGVSTEYASSGVAQAAAPVAARAKRVLAGALARTGRKEQAAVMLAEMLMASPELAGSAFLDYRYILPVDSAKLNSLAPSPQAKAGLRFLAGFENPSYSLDYLKAAAESGLPRKLVFRMFLREVALFEENNASILLGHQQRSASLHRPTVGQRYYKSLLGFVTGLLAQWLPGQLPAEERLPDSERKVALALAEFAASRASGEDGHAWNFYQAYMRYMGGQSDQAVRLGTALSNVPYWKEKAQVLVFLARLDTASGVTAELEKEAGALAPIFYKGGAIQRNALRDYVLLQLERKFTKAGDSEKAVVARAARARLSRGGDLDRFGDERSLPQLISFLAKKNKNPFERFLEAGIDVKAEDVQDRLGSLFLWNMKFEQAEKEFAKLSPKYLAALDRTYSGDLDLFGIDYADGDSKTRRNKRQAAADLARLHKEAPGSAEASLKLAAALFNITQEGRHWVLTRTFKSVYDRYPEDLRMLAAAREHLDRAQKMAKDDETKARVAYQRVLVERALLDLQQKPGEEEENRASAQRKGLYSSLHGFKSTQFYQRYISSCSDFKNAQN